MGYALVVRFLRSALALVAVAHCGPTVPSNVDASVLSDAANTSDAQDQDAAADGRADVDPGPVSVRMDLSRDGGFFAAPFPGEHRRRDDGTVDLTGYPNPRRVEYAQSVIDLAAQRDGFGLTSAVYFQLTGTPSIASLPTVAASVRDDAKVFLVSVEPRPGEPTPARIPVEVTFQADAGPYGARNLLAVRPVQGFVLRPNTLYAAVVLRAVGDPMGRPLEVDPTLRALVEGGRPDALSAGALDAFRRALDALRSRGVALPGLAGLTVFRTGDPLEGFRRFRAHAVAQPLPSPIAPWRRTEQFDTFCVYESAVEMPVYQRGEPPYTLTGGDWVSDARGTPVVQRRERARVVVTVPRRAMPAEGYPIVVFSRTGGGGDRPLVDRGVRSMPGGPATPPGTGPALEFARAGWAGISPDGPHGGARNVTRTDEQLLVFNFSNPVAMRDNLRQSALELVLTARLLEGLRIDSSTCAGAAPESRFDLRTLTVMGHSMGASIAPLAAALEPSFRAMLLSGAGGSWAENVVFKQRPLAVRPLADVLVQYTGTGRTLRTDDPILNLLQWAGEPADAPVFNRHVIAEPVEPSSPRHVLMMQGIVDHYILPPIANAMSLSLGLDLGGMALDGATPELMRFAPVSSLLPLSGGRALPLPVSQNRMARGAAVTAVLTQHREDGVEDGHEVVFQTESARRQYRCFLESLSLGTPAVATTGTLAGPCE